MKKYKPYIFLGAVSVAGFLFITSFTNINAFTGPSTGAGTGSGAIGVDESNNISVGTSTPSASTKMLIVASSTDNSNFGLRVIQPNGNPVLVIRNDGNVGVGTAAPASAFQVQGAVTATSFSGQVIAENISAGEFGANYGGGNFYFGPTSNLGFGIGSLPTHKIEIVSSTAAAGGIAFGDVELYRDTTNRLALGSGDSLNLVSGGLIIGGNTILTSSRLVWAANGSALQPSISFQAGTNNGMYYAGSNVLRLVTAATDRMTINAAGNVGIGTTNPQYGTLTVGAYSATVAAPLAVQVNGVGVGFVIANSATEYTDFASGGALKGMRGYGTVPFVISNAGEIYFSPNGSEVMRLKSGNVGIGTAAPGQKLEVVGNVSSSGLCLGGTCNSTWPLGGSGGGGVGTSTAPSVNALPIWTSANQLGNSLVTQPSANTISIGAGNGLIVGGTTAQSGGNITATGVVAATSFSGQVIAGNVSAGEFGSNYGGGNYSFPANVGIGAAVPSARLEVQGADPVIQSVISGQGGGAIVQGMIEADNSWSRAVFSHNAWWNSTSNLWTVDAIGANDAQAILIPNDGGFQFIVHPSTGNIARTFTHPNFVAGAKVTIDNAGNVGIGTASPAAKLHVSNNSAATGAADRQGELLLRNTNTTANAYTLIQHDSPNGVVAAGIQFVNTVPASNYGRIDLQTRGASGYAVGLSVLNGNVGIGTTAPGYKLDVSGSFRVVADTDPVIYSSAASVNGATLFYGEAGGVSKFRAQKDGQVAALGFIVKTGTDVNGGSNAVSLQSSGNSYINAGNVGIGTTNPGAKLDVLGVASSSEMRTPSSTVNTALSLRYLTGSTRCLQVDASGLVSAAASACGAGGGVTSVFGRTGAVVAASGDYTVGQVTGAAPTASPTFTGNVTMPGTGIWNSSGNVGIGTSGPGYKLQVVSGSGNEFRFTDSTTYPRLYMGGTDTGVAFVINRIQTGATMYFGESGDTGGMQFRGTGTYTFGGGSGKIDVGTVDPVYTIDDKQYATYLPAITGVKEETTGLAELTRTVSGDWQAVLDFGKAEKGSDLWLFAKTTNLKKNFAAMTVLLTPAFDGRAWYKKDPENFTLTIFGAVSVSSLRQSAVEVSYRLTAPRFDAETWSNLYRGDPSNTGFIIQD